jgi:hypothetical protein
MSCKIERFICRGNTVVRVCGRLQMEQRASCGLVVRSCKRHSSAGYYQSMADTIVQLYGLHVSGVMASSRALQSGMRDKRSLERSPQ